MAAKADRSIPHALVCAPHGRDAAIAAALLGEAGVTATLCDDLPAVVRGLQEDVDFAVLSEEATHHPEAGALTEWIERQPKWSDVPFMLLMRGGGGPDRNPAAMRISGVLRNVTFLERPFHPTTFLSVARTALSGRQRQYEARKLIDALREGERRLQTALVAGHLGSWELDLDSQQLTASDACRKLFGANGGDFSYDALLAAIHPDDRARVEAAVAASLASGEDYAIEYRTLWPDGSLHWAEARARRVQEGGGTPRLVGVTSDITERKTAEDRLKRLNETLEDRVAERTAALEGAHKRTLAEVAQRQRAEEQLRQAQKMETIGQLTGGVAHDFNNLLMAVIGNLDLLRKHLAGDPRAQRFIESALLGAQRGAALTQRLLAFARRQDLRVEPTSMADLVRGMSGLLERSVGPDVELAFVLPAGLPPVLVDTNQIELALLNLVVNARDAMPDGGQVTIAVDRAVVPASPDLDAGAYLRLSVTDTGHGMEPSTLKKATEPFFSTKELGKGTGLGLSMIQGLAVQLKGALRLQSEPRKGTVAELWLPAADVDLPEPSPAALPEAPAPAASSRILVVDDDALIAMSAVDMLEDLGHTVLQADSGPRALEILRADAAIDLLMTDYSMPKMTGAQLAKAARELRPELPILLVTGYADLPPGSGIELPRLGKPYQQEQLAAAIAKVLGGRDKPAS